MTPIRLRELVVLALAGLASPARAQAQSEALQTCGAARYFASEYSCFGNQTLCPVMYNLPSIPCAGAGGCYAPQMFSCAGGRLETLPAASTPFTLTAHGTRPTYQNLTVKACGGFLAIGANARQCTSCTGAGPGVQCASYGNKAVLLPSGEMVGTLGIPALAVLESRTRTAADTHPRLRISPGGSIGMSTLWTVPCSTSLETRRRRRRTRDTASKSTKTASSCPRTTATRTTGSPVYVYSREGFPGPGGRGGYTPRRVGTWRGTASRSGWQRRRSRGSKVLTSSSKYLLQERRRRPCWQPVFLPPSSAYALSCMSWRPKRAASRMTARAGSGPTPST